MIEGHFQLWASAQRAASARRRGRPCAPRCRAGLPARRPLVALQRRVASTDALPRHRPRQAHRPTLEKQHALARQYGGTAFGDQAGLRRGMNGPRGPIRAAPRAPLASSHDRNRARSMRLGGHVLTDHRARAALVVVLHGCTQNAAGYDPGTGWSRWPTGTASPALSRAAAGEQSQPLLQLVRRRPTRQRGRARRCRSARWSRP